MPSTIRPTPTISLHCNFPEEAYGYEFSPEIKSLTGTNWLAIEDINIFLSIKQLEILRSTIAVFLEAEKEKNTATASAIVQEAINEASYPISDVRASEQEDELEF